MFMVKLRWKRLSAESRFQARRIFAASRINQLGRLRNGKAEGSEKRSRFVLDLKLVIYLFGPSAKASVQKIYTLFIWQGVLGALVLVIMVIFGALVFGARIQAVPTNNYRWDPNTRKHLNTGLFREHICNVKKCSKILY